MILIFFFDANADRRRQDFTCALAIGILYSKLSLIFDPIVVIGNIPLLLSISAPISSNGFITRFIGLFDKDLSPINVDLSPNPQIKPNISLDPVPEFPKFKSTTASLNGIFLFLRITFF